MLELHAGALGRLRDEPHLDLAGKCRIALELPAEVDVPAEHDALGRLVGEHPRPAALAAVDPAIVDVPAGPRLEHHLRELGPNDVVPGRPPASDVLGEDRESTLDRRVHRDRGPH